MLLLSAGFTILALSENGNVSFWRKMLCQETVVLNRHLPLRGRAFATKFVPAKYGAFSLSCCAAPFSSFVLSSINLYVDDIIAGDVSRSW